MGATTVGVALALGGAFTAHATSTAPAAPAVSGSEQPGASSETDVPADAKPAQTAPSCPGGADVCDTVEITAPAK
ncbi:hypothetical protein ABZ915_16975 [Streptomyces sp. NPDC046915]|uniref:hypothetical protein n=1 Tax=Streptomyces sp. NPDC046915 TaxID=3155257 RepID=UPI0033E4651E